ncbi:MAG: hypothetical protein LBH65_03590, partial [Desulfovibrio sp.]|nr:hypothetical protein [Desulfovibrio sp.]
AEAGFAAASDDQDGVFEAPVAWRTALEAMLPFLPDRALLFTNDERMTLDLRDNGMLRPFPEDRAARLAGWPVELTSGLLYAQLPAYRLVGRKSPPPERPWLSREIEVLAARPMGGWANAGEDG